MEHAQSAAFDHRGAAHAQRGLLGGDDDIAATRHHGVPGEAASRHDAHQGNQSAQLGEQRERFDLQHAGGDRVRIAGTSAAAFGEHDEGQAPLRPPVRTSGPSSRGSCCPACPRARCSRRPWPRSAHRRSGNSAPLTRPMPITRPSAGVRAMRSSMRAPAALCRDDESAVLVKAAGIAQVGDVLAGGSQAELVPLLDGVGPGRVERQRAPLLELGQVGTNMVGIDRLRGRDRVRLVLDDVDSQQRRHPRAGSGSGRPGSRGRHPWQRKRRHAPSSSLP